MEVCTGTFLRGAVLHKSTILSVALLAASAGMVLGATGPVPAKPVDICRAPLQAYIKAALDQSTGTATMQQREDAGVAYLGTGCPSGFLLEADLEVTELLHPPVTPTKPE